nr:uncharacterized protein LOC101238165 isoform X1 [Hydra vulgaris]
MTNVRSVALIRFVICVSIILALIFLVISTSTNHWYFQPIIATKNQSVEVNSGIFQKCYHVKEVKSYNCLSTKFNGFMIAFRLFLFTGIVGYSVLLIYVLFSSFFQEVNFKVLSVMLILTGMMPYNFYTHLRIVGYDCPFDFHWCAKQAWREYKISMVVLFRMVIVHFYSKSRCFVLLWNYFLSKNMTNLKFAVEEYVNLYFKLYINIFVI